MEKKSFENQTAAAAAKKSCFKQVFFSVQLLKGLKIFTLIWSFSMLLGKGHIFTVRIRFGQKTTAAAVAAT